MSTRVTRCVLVAVSFGVGLTLVLRISGGPVEKGASPRTPARLPSEVEARVDFQYDELVDRVATLTGGDHGGRAADANHADSRLTSAPGLANDPEWEGFPRSRMRLGPRFPTVGWRAAELFRHVKLNPRDVYIPKQLRMGLEQRISEFRILDEAMGTRRAEVGKLELDALVITGTARQRPNRTQYDEDGKVFYSFDTYKEFGSKMPPELSSRDGVVYFAYLDQMPKVRRYVELRQFLVMELARDVCAFFEAQGLCDAIDTDRILRDAYVKLQKIHSSFMPPQ
jgi:hypothetical protein